MSDNAKAVGLISFLKSKPGDKNGGTVPAGRWCLHTTSTAPFALIQAGKHARVITWGEVIEVPTQGAVLNASAHLGDIHLAPVLDGVVAPRPAQYSLPVEWTTVPAAGDVPAFLQTQWLDVRNARRAFLVVNDDAANLPLPVTIQHSNETANGAPPVGVAVPTQSNASAASGIVTEIRTVVLNQYSLGLRARDIAPGDPYPHCLLARVRVRATPADFQAFNLLDPFFHVEF